ncbi:GNAT family N-acetyltransferase [Sharpea azabuensis]|uniref:GNAT family N-acetyltransferase n=1 Tax=Sharpea porci TaxID=2652286 RepID=A0A844FQG7_9FIRM|nr:GNAT family N-acetyltransferase [Sharpea porci]MDD6711364.1 GNAT family N-acetyltransferase [Sharpea porci]MDY5280164.1 GNAT family N-acetyltransferase [Sharpea porci]MST88147.1 GNAT family N-acetyltransferase [Sharpea porci]
MEIKEIDFIKDNLLPNFTPYYIYAIYEGGKQVGTLVFRLGSDQEHYYDGHIAYTIEEAYRGHHYAYQACLLLKESMLQLGYQHVLITCDPANLPSKKTIMKLGCTLLGVEEVPKRYRKVFAEGENVKEIYRWELMP